MERAAVIDGQSGVLRVLRRECAQQDHVAREHSPGLRGIFVDARCVGHRDL